MFVTGNVINVGRNKRSALRRINDFQFLGATERFEVNNHPFGWMAVEHQESYAPFGLLPILHERNPSVLSVSSVAHLRKSS